MELFKMMVPQITKYNILEVYHSPLPSQDGKMFQASGWFFMSWAGCRRIMSLRICTQEMPEQNIQRALLWRMKIQVLKLNNPANSFTLCVFIEISGSLLHGLIFICILNFIYLQPQGIKCREQLLYGMKGCSLSGFLFNWVVEKMPPSPDRRVLWGRDLYYV